MITLGLVLPFEAAVTLADIRRERDLPHSPILLIAAEPPDDEAGTIDDPMAAYRAACTSRREAVERAIADAMSAIGRDGLAPTPSEVSRRVNLDRSHVRRVMARMGLGRRASDREAVA